MQVENRLQRLEGLEAKSSSSKISEVDREKTCPLLLRVFQKTGGHHRPVEFDVRGKEPVQDEIQMYTWMDATLRELCNLIKEVLVSARRARLDFSVVYPDRRGRAVLRHLGNIHSFRKGGDDMKTLEELHFQPGDFLDIAIYPQ